jgi:hypothetical protein
MVELLFGSFLLGSLYLAFREDREHDTHSTPAVRIPRAENAHDSFSQSVYEPHPPQASLVVEEELFLVEEPSLVSMLARSSDLPVIQ